MACWIRRNGPTKPNEAGYVRREPPLRCSPNNQLPRRQPPAVAAHLAVDGSEYSEDRSSVGWMSVSWMSVSWVAHPLHEGGLLLCCGEAAVIDDNDAIGYIEDLVVVGDHDDRGVLLTGQLLHQLHHGAA